jgi:hypothetical protein
VWFSNLGFDFANKDLDHLVTGREGEDSGCVFNIKSSLQNKC